MLTVTTLTSPNDKKFQSCSVLQVLNFPLLAKGGFRHFLIYVFIYHHAKQTEKEGGLDISIANLMNFLKHTRDIMSGPEK